MFYYSINSKEKIVHYEGCGHLKNIKKENMKSFDSTKQFRNHGYRICSCCSSIPGLLKSEKKEINKYCQENGLAYYMRKGELVIKTHHSNWKVLVSGDKETLELHHKNSFKKEHPNSVPGYHRQNYTSNTIMGFMEYITKHEDYRKQNPIMVTVKKEPPIRGTKRWNKQQKEIKQKERNRAIWNVLTLIENLRENTYIAQAWVSKKNVN